MKKTTQRNKETYDIVVKQADAILLKDVTKLMHRIERIFVPAHDIMHNTVGDRLSGFLKRIQRGCIFRDVKEFSQDMVCNVLSKNSEIIVRKIDWDTFIVELMKVVNDSSDENYTFPNEVWEEIMTEKKIYEEKLDKAVKKEKIRQLQVSHSPSTTLSF
jgi:hypothetical protein